MKIIPALATALTLLAGAARAQESLPLTVQLNWVAQAEFAGYHVAQEMDFYRDEGLEVTLLPGGPGIPPLQSLARGRADVAIERMPAALVAREKGLPVVNVAQPLGGSGQVLVCRTDSGIASPADLAGKVVGTWFQGHEYPLTGWLARMGLEGQVTLLAQDQGIAPLLQGQADCISAMRYHEYPRILDTGFPAEDLVVLPLSDMLEDGVYTLEQTLADPQGAEALTRFLRASMRGWEHAAQDPEEAARILSRTAQGRALTPEQHRRMVEAMTPLLEPTGALDPQAYQRTVDLLTEGGILRQRPENAWVSTITDRMAPPAETAPPE